MANVLEGQLMGDGMRFGIVVSRFNEFITTKLLGGALDMLRRHGVDDDDVDVAWVPGAFEIPLVAKRLAASGRYDAVICLGVVIRGATSHYDHICSEVSKGIAQISVTTGVPTIFGIVTSENIEQAIERSGTKAGNKGADAALSAIEMASLMEKLDDVDDENDSEFYGSAADDHIDDDTPDDEDAKY